KLQTALTNAPHDDEIGPLISELNSRHEKLGSIKKEIEHLEQKIGSVVALMKMVNAKIKALVDEKYRDKKDSIQVELAQKVQTVLEEYANKLKIRKLELLEGYLLESINALMHKEDFIDKVS